MTPVSEARARPSATSGSRWIPFVRVVWLLLAGLFVGIFIAGVPIRYIELQETCSPGNCLPLFLTDLEVASLRDVGLSIGFYAGYQLGFEIVFASLLPALGLLIFRRKSGDWMGIVVSLALVVLGTNLIAEADSALARNHPPVAQLEGVLLSITGITLLLLFYLFPDARFVPSWTKYFMVATALPLFINPVFSAFLPLTSSGSFTVVFLATLVAGLVVGVASQISRYRKHSGPTQRQQTKWVVFGLGGTAIAAVTWTLTMEVFPLPYGIGRLYWNLFGTGLMSLLLMVLPLSLTFSILRYRLFDIDIIIKRTIVYSSLTAALVAVYFVTVVSLQAAFRVIAGQGSQLAIVASTLMIAALFNPLRRRIQIVINRRFFRGDYDAAQALDSLGETLTEEVDLESIQNALLATVQKTMAPEHVSLWMREASQQH